MIDNIYFKELAQKDPKEICGRISCRYDAVQRTYGIRVWGNDYTISPHEERISCLDPLECRPHPFFYLFIIYYLLRSKGSPPSNEWISEKELPGGATFFRGPHEIPTHMISDGVGNDLATFHKICTALRGVPLDMADASYQFDIVTNIPIAVLYWTGDEEFQPEAKIMFDRTICDHLTSDIVFALAVEVCNRIGKFVADSS